MNGIYTEMKAILRTWRTVGNTGKPKCSPFFPGETPPTILVPHSIDSLAFAVAYAEWLGTNLKKNRYCSSGKPVYLSNDKLLCP